MFKALADLTWFPSSPNCSHPPASHFRHGALLTCPFLVKPSKLLNQKFFILPGIIIPDIWPTCSPPFRHYLNVTFLVRVSLAYTNCKPLYSPFLALFSLKIKYRYLFFLIHCFFYFCWCSSRILIKLGTQWSFNTNFLNKWKRHEKLLSSKII